MIRKAAALSERERVERVDDCVSAVVLKHFIGDWTPVPIERMRRERRYGVVMTKCL